MDTGWIFPSTGTLWADLPAGVNFFDNNVSVSTGGTHTWTDEYNVNDYVRNVSFSAENYNPAFGNAKAIVSMDGIDSNISLDQSMQVTDWTDVIVGSASNGNANITDFNTKWAANKPLIVSCISYYDGDANAGGYESTPWFVGIPIFTNIPPIGSCIIDGIQIRFHLKVWDELYLGGTQHWLLIHWGSISAKVYYTMSSGLFFCMG
jgi:hypothetical protein